MHKTYIDLQRLLSWFSGFSRLVIWQESPGCSTDAVEKGLDLRFTRPSFDSSAHHETSMCSNNERLRTFFDAQEDTV